MKNITRHLRLLSVACLLSTPAFLAAQTGPLIYGYVSGFPSQSSATSDSIIGWMSNNYHVQYVQFYDWQSKHHIPLAGTTSNPSSWWNDIANRTTFRQTILDLIASCHSRGMYAMNYNLIYGAYADYATDGSGVSSQWGLYTSPGGSQWSFNMPGGWATSALEMFNPGNTSWQNYIFGRENDAFAAYPFDGWQVDQMGDWGTMYDSNGNSVDVWSTFAGFLNNAKSATGKRIIFNNVGTYGMFSVCNQTADDAVYVECWEGNGQTTYTDLKNVIDNGLSWSNGTKPVVLAAYMDRGLSNTTGNSFNAPGVLLTDAVIFASGGTHLELGDGGYMLSNEYFPNHNVALGSGLANTLKTYYSFIGTYKNWLYGGFSNSGNVIWTSVPSTGASAQAGSVWAFCKTSGSKSMLNLINLIGESSTNWRDNNGTYPTPTFQSNFTLKYYLGSTTANSVTLASPDINGGAAKSLSFVRGSDGGGNYIQFTVPTLKYWDLIMIQ